MPGRQLRERSPKNGKSQKPEVDVPLWPGKPPYYKKGEKPEAIADSDDPRLRRRHVARVTEPTLSIYPATGARKSKLAVIVCPGGGYHVLSIDVEGYDISRWLNQNGITAAVLKYRLEPLPRDGSVWLPLLDLHRAIRTLKNKAKDYDFDPDYVGVIGFSAGAHLAALSATHSEPGNARATDVIDREDSRPAFTMLIYPLSDKHIESKLTSDVPPAFVVQSADDFIVDSGLRYFAAATAARARTEFHFFERGGHGYGLGVDGGPIAEWPRLAERWLSEIIEPAPAHQPFTPTRRIPREKGFHKRINCGAIQRWQDADGYIWEPDYPYVKDGLTVHRGDIAISGTQLVEIYRSERYSVSALRIPVPNGEYTVRLHFSETYEPVKKPGQRVFAVSLGGKQVLKDFDPLKSAGGKLGRPVVREFRTNVETGLLEVTFTQQREQVTINAVEIVAESYTFVSTCTTCEIHHGLTSRDSGIG